MKRMIRWCKVTMRPSPGGHPAASAIRDELTIVSSGAAMQAAPHLRSAGSRGEGGQNDGEVSK
jgi:hypothetical protein